MIKKKTATSELSEKKSKKKKVAKTPKEYSDMLMEYVKDTFKGI